MIEMPYYNYSTLSNPVLLTVVRYCVTVLPLPCDRLANCPASHTPLHAGKGFSPSKLLTAQVGEWKMDGWVEKIATFDSWCFPFLSIY